MLPASTPVFALLKTNFAVVRSKSKIQTSSNVRFGVVIRPQLLFGCARADRTLEVYPKKLIMSVTVLVVLLVLLVVVPTRLRKAA